MKKQFTSTILLFAFFIASAKNTTITFFLDMRQAGKPNSTVALRGNIAPLSWNKNGVVLSDEDKDGIFTATVSFEVGKETTLLYKYVSDAQWENIDDNRNLDLTQRMSINDTWSKENNPTAPYFFKKDGKILDFASRMASEQRVYGVSQIIIRNDKIDTLLTWGDRDVEAKLPVNANTLFHIGGMGQSLTAFAVLRAAETKRLDLDQPLNGYLKTMQIKGDFTIRDLMLGKLKFNGMEKPHGYKKGQQIPTLEAIFKGKNTNTPRMKQKKGISDQPLFNIFAALIAQQLLEDVYQKTFSAIIEQEILTPLNMKNTFVKAELSDIEAQNASVGYDKNGKALEGKRFIFPELGFGGVWTTPSDYSKFILYLIKASRGENNTLLSQSLAKAAIEPSNQFRALIFPQGDNGNYLGGAATGFRTQTSFNAQENTVMVTFMNSYENWRTMLEVENAGRKLMNQRK
jgi:Beta-lactamase